MFGKNKNEGPKAFHRGTAVLSEEEVQKNREVDNRLFAAFSELEKHGNHQVEVSYSVDGGPVSIKGPADHIHKTMKEAWRYSRPSYKNISEVEVKFLD